MLCTNVATFVRDCLAGSVKAIEYANGQVVGIVVDAVLGIVVDVEDAVKACIAVLRDVKAQREYFQNAQRERPDWMRCAPGGAILKIGVEYGLFSQSTISSDFLGDQVLFVSNAINMQRV